MRAILKLSSIICIIALAIVLSVRSFELPEVKTSNISKQDFSASRAMQYVNKIASGRHEIGSYQHDNVRDYLVNALKKLGMKPSIQKTYSENKIWGNTVSGNVENIYVILKGSSKAKNKILIDAHYDSTNGGPGAADDAMGIASLLETIRNLKAGHQLKNDIIFLFSDGEETGLLGAKAFINKNNLAKHLSLVMNFEARGNAGPVIMFETADKNGWYMNEFKKAVEYPVAYSFSYDIYKYMPNDTDFTLFKEAGNPGFNFATLEGSETYHNSNDTPKNLDENSLQHEGSYALSLVKHFGNLNLTNKKSSNAIYFTLTKSIFIVYSAIWAIPLAIFSLILYIIIFVIGYNNRFITIKGTILGTVLILAVAGISTAIGAAVNTIFSKLYYNSNFGYSPDELKNIAEKSNIWISVMAVLVLMIIAAIYLLVNKMIPYLNILMGSMFIWIALTLVSSFLFKSSSYIFALPCIFILSALLIHFTVKIKKNTDLSYCFLMIVSIMVSILIYVPPVFLFFEAMGISDASILAGIIALPISNIVLVVFLTMSGSVSKEKMIEV